MAKEHQNLYVAMAAAAIAYYFREPISQGLQTFGFTGPSFGFGGSASAKATPAAAETHSGPARSSGIGSGVDYQGGIDNIGAYLPTLPPQAAATRQVQQQAAAPSPSHYTIDSVYGYSIVDGALKYTGNNTSGLPSGSAPAPSGSAPAPAPAPADTSTGRSFNPDATAPAPIRSQIRTLRGLRDLARAVPITPELIEQAASHPFTFNMLQLRRRNQPWRNQPWTR